ncbi:MAG TPA: hypothetical protein VJY47_00760 [Candidatus Dojkabacteria bacterium]|nr:hypothetical protein [Candidatus Dojkabacteria bacterium]
MEIFKSILNNWSIYQLLALTGMFLFVFLFIVFTTWFLSGKKKEFVKLSSLSLLSASVLTVLSFITLNVVFNESIRYIFLLTPVLILVVEIISLGMILGFFTSQKMQKVMKPHTLKKEVLKDSLQLSIFIILLIMAFILSLSGIYFTFVLTTAILSIATIWINYLLVSLIFKND